MEPSGTYLDAFRQALGDAGVEAHWVSPKQSHDFAEVFDGVPSQHDGKDAAVIAELAAIEKSRPWPYRQPSEAEQQLVSGVEWIDIHRREKAAWCGRVEGLLARHWPEAKELLSVKSFTLLQALAHYGGPRVLAADTEAAAQLRKWGGRYLSETKIQDLIRSAANTVGVRPTSEDLLRLARYASKALAADAEIKQARRALKRLAAKNPVITAMARVVGAVTACVFGRSAGLCLRVGLPQGDGLESEGAEQRAVERSVEDQQAWAQRRAALALFFGAADDPSAAGASLVPGEEGQERRQRAAGGDRGDAQVGPGAVPRGARSNVRAVVLVSRSPGTCGEQERRVADAT
jgi:transposase